MPKRFALVIGNGAYQNTPPLANPKNDAEDMAAALQTLGFKVVLGLDLDKREMDRKISEFARSLSCAEAAVFHYSGHGLQVAGVNYLIPVDARLASAAALDFETVRLDLVQRTVERETETNILFLDACRDNPLARSLARALGTRSIEIGRGLASVDAGAGTLISFSTQPGNVASDGSGGRNSPYSGPLVKAIATPGKDLLSILIQVRNEVRNATNKRQVPWEHSALLAPFYFKSAPEPAPAPPPPEPPINPLVPEHEYWADTKDRLDPNAFERFLARFPDGDFAELAASRAVERIAAYNDAQVLERLLSDYPQSPRKAQALARLAGLLWLPLAKSDDFAAIEAFIGRFPHDDLAKQAADRATTSIAACDRAKALEQFLADFPASPRKAKVETRLASVLWGGMASRDIAELEAFVRRFPKSPEAGKARVRIEKLRLAEEKNRAETEAWASIANTRSIPEIEEFLEKWRYGAHASAAKSRIKELRGSFLARYGALSILGAAICLISIIAFALRDGGVPPNSASAYAESGDAAHGEQVFKQCKVCHAIGPGAKAGVGPAQNGVYGSKAASRGGYDYSRAMKEVGDNGLVWNGANLDKYLENPKAFVPGTKMVFPGLKNEKDRQDVIAYLKANRA
jgi:cytochrome c2/outer membrane protein assembly factor BamD (BamD/ComL family)